MGILALILALIGVPSEAHTSHAAETSRLVVLLATDRPVYTVGDTTTFTIAVDNRSDAPAKVLFRSEQLHDVVVSAGEREAWRWSAGRDFADEESERSFPPGVTLLGRVTWDWRDTAGAPLPPDVYRVVGTLMADPPRAGNVLEIRFSRP